MLERALDEAVVSNRIVLALIRLTGEGHNVEFSRFKVLESSLKRS